MKFIFYSSVHFEKWDWTNSVEKGIGGSETSHVEMAWRLAKRGHEVINYVPLPDDSSGEWRGTKWYDFHDADFSQKGLWILYRTPSTIDKFPPKSKRENQTIWLLMQDWDYPDWTDKRIKECDSVIAMSKCHARNMANKYPIVKEKLWLNSNGIKIDLIEETEKRGIKRNPYKIMYASSPDRGLKPALISFKKACEYVPDLEFHCFYGFDNIDKLIAKNPKSTYKKMKEEIFKLMDQPNVHWHGRVSQNELYEHWFSSGMWIYQTSFFETSCISLMEAQSMGAIPIFSPVWTQAENINHGIPIWGDPDDPLTNCRFASEIVKLALLPDLQEKIRKEMMPWARERYNWERMVDLWEARAGLREYKYDYPSVMKKEDYVNR